MKNYVSPWMDEDLSIFRDAAARFLDAEMVPNEVEWRKQQHVGKDIWLKAGPMGLLCTDVSAEYGGVGGAFRPEALVYEGPAPRRFQRVRQRLPCPWRDSFVHHA